MKRKKKMSDYFLEHKKKKMKKVFYDFIIKYKNYYMYF